MRIRLSLMVLLALGFLFSAAAFAEQSKPEKKYEPAKGEHVYLYHRQIKPGHMKQVQAAYHSKLRSELDRSKSQRKAFWIVDEEKNHIISIAFGKADTKEMDENSPIYKRLNESLKAHISKTEIEHFVLVDINNEEYVPKIGDKVCIWERNLIPATMENAKDIYMTKIFPFMAKDEQSMDSYLLEDKDNNRLFVIDFFRGSYKHSKALHKNLETLEPMSKGEYKMSTWTVFEIYE